MNRAALYHYFNTTKPQRLNSACGNPPADNTANTSISILARILLQTHNPIQHHPLSTALPIHAKIPHPHPLEPDRLGPRSSLLDVVRTTTTTTARLVTIRHRTRIALRVLVIHPRLISHNHRRLLLPRLGRPRRPLPDLLEARLHHRVGEDVLRVRVDVLEEALGVRGRVGGSEERVDDADFRLDGAVVLRRRSDPVDEAFRFLRGGAAVVVGRFLVRGVDEGHGAAGGVPFERGGRDGEGGFHQTDGLAWSEAEVVRRVHFAEVAAFDVDVFGEGDGVGPHGRILGEGQFDHLHVVVG